MLPKSIPVPAWAVSMVSNYRNGGHGQLSPLPAAVTDEMVFARLEDCRGMDQDDVEAAVRALIEEVAAP